MARAFMAALRRWLDHHRPDNHQHITLPTAVVSDVELAHVLRGLFEAQK